MARALELAQADRAAEGARLLELRDRLAAGLLERIPGVKTTQVEMPLKKPRAPRELTTYAYSLRIQNDGGLQIVEER